ncbi:hypothetical protein [Undibacterium sp. YM2]|uniref:hypothetical protein n=1 Tax=Undibacterium sp. YM2 TaxID=2058625 RepID=UPI0013893D33|nr:hypothetical protein [Undibacterium sp. YM2]
MITNYLNKLTKFAVVTILCGISLTCAADANRYIWEGDISEDNHKKFQAEIKNNASLNELEFKNSRGAPKMAGILTDAIAGEIESRKLQVFLRGQCASACANIVLLSAKRTLLPSINGVRTHLFLHVARASGSGEINYGFTEKINKKSSRLVRGNSLLKYSTRCLMQKKLRVAYIFFVNVYLQVKVMLLFFFAQVMRAHSLQHVGLLRMFIRKT